MEEREKKETVYARELLTGAGLDADAIESEVDSKFMSAFVRARKRLRP